MRRLLLGLMSSLVMTASALAGDAEHKAVFVYKLLDFVQWPEGAPAARRLCAVVPDAAWPAFRALDGQGGLKVVRLGREASLSGCSIVYLGEMSASELMAWVRRIDGEPVLSVCESWRCARDGVMVGLGVEDNRLFFEANTGAMNRSGIRVGARLMRLARTVY